MNGLLRSTGLIVGEPFMSSSRKKDCIFKGSLLKQEELTSGQQRMILSKFVFLSWIFDLTRWNSSAVFWNQVMGNSVKHANLMI